MKIRRLLLVAILAIIHSSTALSQTLWLNTKAGMSPAQVQQAVPEARPTRGTPGQLGNGAQELLSIEHFTLVNERFPVKFYFLAGKLVQVTLKLTPEQPYSSAMRVFDDVLAALRMKYGRETSDRSTESSLARSRLATWASGRTNISVYANAVEGFSSLLNINYQVRIAREAESCDFILSFPSCAWERPCSGSWASLQLLPIRGHHRVGNPLQAHFVAPTVIK